MSTTNSKKTAVVKRAVSQNSKKTKTKRAGRRYRKNPIMNTENYHVQRTELWTDVNLTTSDPANTVFRISFDPLTGPAWFKKLCNLYEMYQIHWIKLYFETGMPTTATGNYVLSYNTNLQQISDARTFAQCSAQKNAMIKHVSRDAVVMIPGGALPHFRTNAVCNASSVSLDSWNFNVELMRNYAGNFYGAIRVEYSITFRNPQID